MSPYSTSMTQPAQPPRPPRPPRLPRPTQPTQTLTQQGSSRIPTRGPLASLRRSAETLSEAGHTLLPISCAGCGRWEVALCTSCRLLLGGSTTPVRVEDDLPALDDLPVWALAPYQGPVRSLIVSWKNGSRDDLAPLIESATQHCGRELAMHVALPHVPVAPHLLVIPAPSGWRRRLQGRLVAARLADALARGIAQGLETTHPTISPRTIASVDLLRRRGGATHQSGRSSRGRRSNRSRPPRLIAPTGSRPVILVDDVVTTGATLASCRQSLIGAGSTVVGAFVIAAAHRTGGVWDTPSTSTRFVTGLTRDLTPRADEAALSPHMR